MNESGPGDEFVRPPLVAGDGHRWRTFPISGNQIVYERQTSSLQYIDQAVAFVLRHGLAIMLAALLTVTLLPFAAPIAMHFGWASMGNVLYRLYSPFCHQLPQRSWFLFGNKLTYTLKEIQQIYPVSSLWELREFVGTPAMGWKVAWSDRMISFYALTPIFGLTYLLLRRTGRQIAHMHWKVLVISLVPLVIDGGTHALNDMLAGISPIGGFRDTNQWLVRLTVNAFPGFYAGDHFGTFNWWARLATGALAAWGIAFTVFPLVDQIFKREANIVTRQ